MSSKPFRFKEFTILQDQCAMKVGTDGVLLGAWVQIEGEESTILDIGTGSGLIALQLAQRCSASVIDALEIEDKAFEQAVENFENSPWGDRLFCYHASLQDFTSEIEEQYDLIVSNPPFFNDTFKQLEEERALARHTINLSYEELISATSGLLAPQGSCAFIIPFSEETDFLSRAQAFDLKAFRITRVRGNIKSDLKRSLIQLSRIRRNIVFEELIIEQERHEYTEEYKDLVKDFYLKM